MMIIFYVGAILLFIIFSSIVPVLMDGTINNGMTQFKNQCLENFHLNNASTFIGYGVFDSNLVFTFFYVFSLLIYLIEHFMIKNGKILGKGVQIFQIAVFIVGVIGQIVCAYIILKERGATC